MPEANEWNSIRPYGVVCQIDDVLIFGVSQEEHDCTGTYRESQSHLECREVPIQPDSVTFSVKIRCHKCTKVC